MSESPCPSCWLDSGGTLLRCMYKLGHDGEHCAPLFMHWVDDEGGETKLKKAEPYHHGCPMGCDSPWGQACKCGGKCHLHPVDD